MCESTCVASCWVYQSLPDPTHVTVTKKTEGSAGCVARAGRAVVAGGAATGRFQTAKAIETCGKNPAGEILLLVTMPLLLVVSCYCSSHALVVEGQQEEASSFGSHGPL